jgi:hypothetical protein
MLTLTSRHLLIDGHRCQVTATQTEPHRHRLRCQTATEAMQAYLTANEGWIAQEALMKLYNTGRLKYEKKDNSSFA